ncbi:MAG: hypothetical protein EA424_27655 [Planctomycetaceae bacterium]|nr:MAG: hypothetical protein EA424_27655 [Planctomycetaceae bacterium]
MEDGLGLPTPPAPGCPPSDARSHWAKPDAVPGRRPSLPPRAPRHAGRRRPASDAPNPLSGEYR